MYQIPHSQILNWESEGDLPMKEKRLGSHWSRAGYFFHWRMALQFAVHNMIVRDLAHAMNSGYSLYYFSYFQKLMTAQIFYFS